MKIRQARLEDSDLVYGFHRALYLEHRARVMPEELEILFAYRQFPHVLREDVDAMLRNDTTVLLVAERIEAEQSHPVGLGYISGYIQNDTRRVLSRKGIVGDWYVDPDGRGQGVGRALMQTLFAIFRESGCSIVETSTWSVNTETRKAMDRLGFREIQVTYRQQLESVGTEEE